MDCDANNICDSGVPGRLVDRTVVAWLMESIKESVMGMDVDVQAGG
jgi:hypothetical protein